MPPSHRAHDSSMTGLPRAGDGDPSEVTDHGVGYLPWLGPKKE